MLLESIALQMCCAVVGLHGSGSGDIASLNLLLWFDAGDGCVALMLQQLVLFDVAAMQYQVMDALVEFSNSRLQTPATRPSSCRRKLKPRVTSASRDTGDFSGV
ncbi:hypothetical protein Nepgr_014654 [Nepenthes gracilis]|uniref:Uncharacterized protein n=1 Tax=Nepenthes gracilis TaxID=150966 RepID=A0AAD3SJX1_NEPGR|nr:hypothetical protein Nepgr_014654 [Nepenthes gracilis]